MLFYESYKCFSSISGLLSPPERSDLSARVVIDKLHWIKDDNVNINVKDEEGCPYFALINKATGQAIKHSIGVTYPVQLKKYNPDKLDKSVVWTMGKNLDDGYRT
ncbi:ricin B lectin domain-containing protein, partial [Tanacetum coccineum]